MKKIIIYLMLPLMFQGCSGCSKSGRYKSKRSHVVTHIDNDEKDDENEVERKALIDISDDNIIKMKKENGVYKIPIMVNGIKMYFIFDTGASLISISNVEASFLYKQGKLSEDDFIGSANFIDANGDISEGAIIRLREISIGNRTLNNIEASVVNNSQAPLLFGQSALEKFGKISIDYNKNILIFE